MAPDFTSFDDAAIMAEASRRMGLPYDIGSYYLPLVTPASVAADAIDRLPVVEPARLFDRKTIEDFAASLASHYSADLPDYESVRALGLGLGYNPIAAQLYYQVVRATQPELIVEIGAGISTFYAHRALAGSGHIICIDPYPSAAFEEWCRVNAVELRKRKLQTEISRLDLESRTLLFVDSTHVCSVASELHRIFVDLLPRLLPGSLVHFDDIFLPFSCIHQEYNNFASTVNWYESTLLGIFLSASNEYETVLPQYWMGRNHVLRPALEHALPIYKATHWQGGAYWIRKRFPETTNQQTISGEISITSRRKSSRFDVKTHEYRVGPRTYILYNDAVDTLLSGSLAETLQWEPWQVFLYSKLIKPSAICFDIGGNIGTNAIAMAQYAPEGKVFSFEPVLPTFEILERNFHENGIQNAFAFNMGIADVPGDKQIFYNRLVLGGASQLTKPVKRALGATEFVQTIHMERLDDWRRAHGALLPDFIKVDVEGFEKQVLESGEESFFQSRETLAIFAFAIAPQRRAADSAFPGPQGDVIFLDLLLRRYQYVFLIRRDSKLLQVTSYKQLRTSMLGGFPVADLLCCQIVPEAVREFINTECSLPTNIPTRIIHSSDRTVIGYNQHADGWSGISHGLNGTRSAVFIGVSSPCRAKISFTQMHSSISGRTTHPILVATSEGIRWTDPTDTETSIELEIGPGTTTVFLESEHALRATDYLGNPNDPRTVGFRFDITLC